MILHSFAVLSNITSSSFIVTAAVVFVTVTVARCLSKLNLISTKITIGIANRDAKRIQDKNPFGHIFSGPSALGNAYRRRTFHIFTRFSICRKAKKRKANNPIKFLVRRKCECDCVCRNDQK